VTATSWFVVCAQPDTHPAGIELTTVADDDGGYAKLAVVTVPDDPVTDA